MLWSMVTRTPLRLDVVRDRGAVAPAVVQGQIENVYRLQIMNATEVDQKYVLSVQGIDGVRIVSGVDVFVDAASAKWFPVRLRIPPNAASPGAHPIAFTITAYGQQAPLVTEKSIFLIPR